MKKLLNTLYVTTENTYLSLDGENVVVQSDGNTLGRLPLHMIDGIMAFGYIGASPALMGKCAEMNKSLVFLKPSGRFLAKVTGKSYGNILLRRAQYRICDNPEGSLAIARNIISAKLSNCNAVLSRAVRDHAVRIDTDKFTQVSGALQSGKVKAYHAQSADSLRGIEGECASLYFSVFDAMICSKRKNFFIMRGHAVHPWTKSTRCFRFRTVCLPLCVSVRLKRSDWMPMPVFIIQKGRGGVLWHWICLKNFVLLLQTVLCLRPSIKEVFVARILLKKKAAEFC